jgi:hypothetical protein
VRSRCRRRFRSWRRRWDHVRLAPPLRSWPRRRISRCRSQLDCWLLRRRSWFRGRLLSWLRCGDEHFLHARLDHWAG